MDNIWYRNPSRLCDWFLEHTSHSRRY